MVFVSLSTIDFWSQLSEVRSDAPIQLADYRKLMMFIFSCNLYNLLIPQPSVKIQGQTWDIFYQKKPLMA